MPSNSKNKHLFYFIFQIQILEITHFYNKITSIKYSISLVTYKYILEITNENFNLLEYRLFNTLIILYKCNTLWKVTRKTILDSLLNRKFIFKYIMGVTSFFAVIIQFNRYA